jgi:hypothetical protein
MSRVYKWSVNPFTIPNPVESHAPISDNTKINFNHICRKDVDWINLAQDTETCESTESDKCFDLFNVR